MVVRSLESWPPAVVATVAMVVLAALDLAGTFAAKEAVQRRSVPIGFAGALLFLLLFLVLAASLHYAELAPVTFGWIVILQIGVLALDRFRYGTELSAGAWVAIAAMILAQAYLLLGPTISGSASAPDATQTVSAPAVATPAVAAQP